MKIKLKYPNGEILEDVEVGIAGLYVRDSEEKYGGTVKIYDSVKDAEDKGCSVVRYDKDIY
jgi:hypothetical protein